MKKYALFILFMCVVMVSCADSDKTQTSISETTQTIIDTTDAQKEDVKVTGIDMPFVNHNEDILGSSFSNKKKMGQIRFSQLITSQSDYFLSTYINDNCSGGTEYYSLGNHIYIGVEDDKITAYLEIVTTQVNNLLQNEKFYNTSPKIVNGNNDYVMLWWRINNGYLLVSARNLCGDSEWYNYIAEAILIVDDLEKSKQPYDELYEENEVQQDNNTTLQSNQNSTTNTKKGDLTKLNNNIITEENFEKVLNLTKRTDYYNNGIFDVFFEEEYSNEVNCTYEYIGTSTNDFENKEYGFLTYDIYCVVCSNGMKKYYLMPYNEYIGAVPNIYIFDEEATAYLVWIGQQ